MNVSSQDKRPARGFFKMAGAPLLSQSQLFRLSIDICVFKDIYYPAGRIFPAFLF